jgi:hypothetical protein
MKDFRTRLAQLRGINCEGVHFEHETTPETETNYWVRTSIQFSDKTQLRAQFWRLIKAGRPLVSIFDHRQQYGLPAPIDALQVANDELRGKELLEAAMDRTTGDLHFRFDGQLTLEVFNFTRYEIWELAFPDGTGELSNYALAE